MKTAGFAASLVLILLGASVSAWAAPRLEVSLSPQELHPGESTQMTIEIFWPQDEGPYTFAFPSLSLKNLTLSRQGESEESASIQGAVWAKKTFVLELKAWEPGDGTVEGFPLNYTDAQGAAAGSLQVLAHTVRITALPRSPRGVFAAAGGAAVVLLLAGLWGLRRMRGKRKKSALPEENKSEAEKTILRIRQLAEASEKDPAETRLRQIGTALRSFVIAHYELGDAGLGENDMIRSLESKKQDSQEINILRELFARLHEVKYSGTRLTDRDLKEFSEEIVRYLSGKRVVGRPG